MKNLDTFEIVVCILSLLVTSAILMIIVFIVNQYNQFKKK